MGYRCAGRSSRLLHGPYVAFAGNTADAYDAGTALFAQPCEDPTVWVDEHGQWHLLAHAFRLGMVNASGGGGPHAEGNGYGVYATAPHPYGPWQVQENLAAYSADVTFVDGTIWSLQRRERPKVLLDNRGRPSHLFTAVCPPGSEERGGGVDPLHCFTLAQAVDWEADIEVNKASVI